MTATSPYAYDKVPRFKREASSLDLDRKGSTFYGNLVTACVGRDPCYSKLSKLLCSISQRSSSSSKPQQWSDDERMTVRGALWTRSEKLRTYFVSLLEHTGNTQTYKELYTNLANDKYKVSDDKAGEVLDQFAKMVDNNDDYLLQCLANYTCTQKSRPLWNELQENEVDNDDLRDQDVILEKVDQVRQSPTYQAMAAKGVHLDDNEILAIYIYCSNDEFADVMQKHLKVSCRWKQTFYYFVRGVLKIYDCKIYGEDVSKLPQNLYHPVFLSFDEEKGVTTPMRLLQSVNCTASTDIARDFAPPDGSMFVIKDCAAALSQGDLIAAPIDWLSPHPNENEWVILPCTFFKCERPVKYVHNSQLINVVEYKTINPVFFGVDIFTKLGFLTFINHLSQKRVERVDDDTVFGDGDDEKEELRDISFYKKECDRLKQELNALRTQMGMDEAAETEDKKQEEEEEKEKKKDIKIPFKKVEDEAYLITEGKGAASMCVTSCNGELNPPFISAKGINYLKQHFQSNELDIFVDTYAKCGTTVGIKMVYKILEANGKVSAGSNKEKLNDPWNAVPWIEVDVSQQLLGSPSPNDFLSFIEHSNNNKIPRLWKTHAPLINFPASKIGENTKILHIIRNPKDVVCSYYDFFRQEPMVAYKGSFNTLFDWFCDGSVVHSSIFDFELNWFRAQRDGVLTDKQLLIIAYEDIKRKPKEIIQRVADFLGYTLSEKQLEEVHQSIDFQQSKKEAAAKGGSDIQVIVNKGQIGRWKHILTEQQSHRMDRIMAARLKDSGIRFTFE
eukprot:CAMPEP_0197030102 /NCGR_PEP_ID=MMETSP1384-20130603/9407_1 /TAXON_ID=29189 /ORGANISM="Ammonia sp." /LENGTH=785 /DNA_ID=CAMNT_0042459385 /DNA_START=13 /DNA_END=2370 /DNA_ORIENTATION=+